ncbi:MAG: biopolymer transporter ExbD [Candidatus Hydrogenedentota bacterium]|nr:MAG: biopolymer transporter ExbD [Candidatus Hydrogenedentota bacterium]
MDLSGKVPSKRARIEIVPLIDCMFLLLVFFVYSMMTLTQPRGIPVNLPRATTASAVREESLSISITSANEIYLDKEKVSLDMLEARIAVARSANPSLRVFINGDTNAYHGTIIGVLDILRMLSVEHVAIQTAPAADEEE